jgi:ribose transport system permease protein
MTKIEIGADPMTDTPASPDDEPDVRPSFLRRAFVYFTVTPALWTYVVLIVLVILFTILSGGTFATASNLKNVLLDGSLLMVVSVGMTMVIITGGIDLSIGAVTIFGGVAASQVMTAIGGDSIGVMLLGAVAAVVIGVFWGFVSGGLVSYARVPPLIATLAVLGMASGLALVVTNGINARDVPLSMVTVLGNGSIAGIPWLVIIAVVVATLGTLYLRLTKAGLYLYAIGSNRDAALRSGIKVRANTTSVYVIMGALAGFAGYLYLARFATTQLTGHTTDSLQAIAAVVLGGTSLFGGRGGISGTIAGVLIPAVLNNGLVILGVQPFWQQFAIGLVLVLAVYTDYLRRRRLEIE